MVSERFGFFVDAAFLKAEGAKALGLKAAETRLDARLAVDAFRHLGERHGGSLLRCYWYDGAFPVRDRRASSQRSFLDAIALTPGLTLRLGTVKSLTPPWLHALKKVLGEHGLDADALGLRLGPIDVQKGVDTLIALDLARLAQKRAFSTAFLVAGDRDLLDAVHAAQDEGCVVVLVHPERAGVDPELRRSADDVVSLSRHDLAAFLSKRAEGEEEVEG
jgi:uncharacterized LabA/DUF88 family protein